MKPATADVVVVGAGVIGCAVARELAGRGLAVTVVERDSPGRRATWAAAGMLSPLGEAREGGPFLELADESLRRYASFVEALREETSIDVEYHANGKLYVSLSEEDEDLRSLTASPLAGRFDVRALSSEEARRLEPGLSSAIRTAVLVGRDHRVNNRLLAQALLASATAAGVTFRSGSPVAAVEIRNDRIRGVRLMSGERVEADRVIIAAGAWSGSLAGLPRPVPVRPVKGQMFAVAGGPAGGRGVPGHVIFAARCYIIPRRDGRILVGATEEEAGFCKGPTPRGLASLMQASMELVPRIGELPLVETWFGFRPGTPDDLPILGSDPGVDGLLYATGHYRNGILLAPITAACIADLVLGTTPPVPLQPFGIERFTGT